MSCIELQEAKLSLW